INPHVVELHDGGIRKLADDLRLAQELLLLRFAEGIGKSLEGHDAADDVVARHFNAAGSAGAERLDAFVPAFLQSNHQAERSNRAARSRKPCPFPLDCVTGTGVSLRRASGYSSSARASAGAYRARGSFARQRATMPSKFDGTDGFACDGGSGVEERTRLQMAWRESASKGRLPVTIS